MGKNTIPSTFELDNEDALLDQNIKDRSYAKEGSSFSATKIDEPKIERVPLSMDDFNMDEAELEEERDENGRLLVDEDELTRTATEKELPDDEVALNKSVQRKIAKSQAKNITNFYLMFLMMAIRWICKTDENKIYIAEAQGKLSANQLIAGHPLITHIRNANEIVDEIEVDEDAREAIEEAMEIYLTSMNIQTSPGANLAIAMGVPAVTMFMEGMKQKRNIKGLITAASNLHQESVVVNQQLQSEIQSQSQTNATLMAKLAQQEAELNEARLKPQMEVTTEKKPEVVAKKRAVNVKPAAEKASK